MQSFVESLHPHDLPQRHPAIRDEAGTLDRVEELAARVDAQQMQDRRGQIGRTHGPVLGEGADPVARPDDLATNPGTGEGDGKDAAPVIAAAVVVETGGVAEFADPKADGC